MPKEGQAVDAVAPANARRVGGSTILDRLRGAGKNVTDVSFDQMLAMLQADKELADPTDFGDGFTFYPGQGGKAKLVGAPMIILDWHANPGDFGRPYFNVTAMLKDGRRVRFNDGSYPGVAGTLNDANEAGFTGAIYCPGGLKMSEYDLKDPETHEVLVDPGTGKARRGKSFWLVLDDVG